MHNSSDQRGKRHKGSRDENQDWLYFQYILCVYKASNENVTRLYRRYLKDANYIKHNHVNRIVTEDWSEKLAKIDKTFDGKREVLLFPILMQRVIPDDKNWMLQGGFQFATVKLCGNDDIAFAESSQLAVLQFNQCVRNQAIVCMIFIYASSHIYIYIFLFCWFCLDIYALLHFCYLLFATYFMCKLYIYNLLLRIIKVENKLKQCV